MALRRRNDNRKDDLRYQDSQASPDELAGDGFESTGEARGVDANGLPDGGIDRPAINEIPGSSASGSRKKRTLGPAIKSKLPKGMPGAARPEKKGMPHWLKVVMVWGIIIFLILIIALMILARIIPGTSELSPVLQAPEGAVSKVVTPIQNAFATVTDAVVGYLRKLKLRSNIEYEYNKIKDENTRLIYQSMLVTELQTKLSFYENLFDEISVNEAMNPIPCTVIGRDEGNYFSVFTINKGLKDGIEDNMAVTTSGALIGYTYDTKETTASVRSIIDSEAGIAALIESSRGQGVISGTLGVNGEAMCRMYYLTDNTLPRPGDTVVTSGMGMSFPKGIPIGTVRESTRGMEANKQYIVVEPLVDFQHIEYVIVYRYKPDPEPVQGQNSGNSYTDFVPLDTPRPVPTINIDGSSSSFFGTPAPSPEAGNETPAPGQTTPAPSQTPSPTAPDVIQTPDPNAPNIEYQVPNASVEPTTVPTPEPTPSPTPEITFSPGQYTVEDD